MRYLLLFVLLFSVIACNQKDDAEVKQTNTVTENEALATTDESTYTNKAPAFGTLRGKVEVSESEDATYIYIVDNWMSRSRVSYLVSGELLEELKELNEAVVNVKGNIEMSGQWNGTIEVTEIISIEDSD